MPFVIEPIETRLSRTAPATGRKVYVCLPAGTQREGFAVAIRIPPPSIVEGGPGCRKSIGVFRYRAPVSYLPEGAVSCALPAKPGGDAGDT